MRLGRIFPALALLLLASTAAETQSALELYRKRAYNPEEALYLDCIDGFQLRTPQREACTALLDTPELTNPKRAEDFVRRSKVYATIEEYDLALADGDKAVQLDPDNIEAYIARGSANWYLERIAAAALDFDRAIRIDENNSDALFGRGLVYSAFGEFGRALNRYNQSIANKPEFAAAYFYRGEANAWLGHHESAIEDFGTALRLNPGDWRSLVSRGNSFSALGQFGAALGDFEEAVDRAPEFAAPHNSIAWLRATAPDEAIRDGNVAVSAAQRAAEIEPGEPNIQDTLAASYAELGDFDSAVEAQQKAINLWRSSGDLSEIAGAEERLALYQSGRPYRDTQ
jgi:tetratricopeptide (TPR) repeat protein